MGNCEVEYIVPIALKEEHFPILFVGRNSGQTVSTAECHRSVEVNGVRSTRPKRSTHSTVPLGEIQGPLRAAAEASPLNQHIPKNVTCDAVRLVRSTNTDACSNSRVYVQVLPTRAPFPLGAPSWHLASG